ncbi:ABC transporter permease [Actinocrispum sp. NPDC049592]|uniref:ABC transporter permease n=1 Tax=Actinocrispum sp. NPDC049592 TaxID=3154835 RepID=UPI003439F4F2
MTTAIATRVSPGRAVGHGLTLAGRSIKKVMKSPEQLVEVTISPIIMLVLFSVFFGGAIAMGDRTAYTQDLLPGLMVQTTLFASLGTGVALCTDISKGVFDRFRSLPIARSAPLLGAVFGDVVRYVISLLIMIVCGVILGFRIHTGFFSAVLDLLLMVGFGLCLCWISVLVGLLVKSPQAVPGIMVALIFPLSFASNVFVPTATLPSWVRGFTEIQPVSLLTEVNRGLLTGGTDVSGPLLGSLAWMVGVVAVFYPLAMRAYKRRMGG